MEIRVPHSGFRADVMAYKPGVRQPQRSISEDKASAIPSIGTTAIFECKQARSDFLKDSYGERESLDRLKVLETRRRKLDDLLGVHLPSLRKGESLFPECDSFDHSRYEHKTYRKVMKEIGAMQNRVYAKTKFEKLVRFNCANLYYLVVEEGIIEHHEVPKGWGLLIRNGAELRVGRLAKCHRIAERTQLATLQRIASTATHRLNRQITQLFCSSKKFQESCNI